MPERIRQLRQRLGLSQTEFAKRMGMTRSMISNLELGLIEIPDYKLSMICQQYNVNEHWLRTGEGEMFQPQPASLDAMAQANQIDALTRAVVETLIEMPQAQRDAFTQLVQDVAERVRRAEADGAQPLQIDQDVKALIRDAKAQGRLDSPDIPELQTK